MRYRAKPGHVWQVAGTLAIALVCAVWAVIAAWLWAHPTNGIPKNYTLVSHRGSLEWVKLVRSADNLSVEFQLANLPRAFVYSAPEAAVRQTFAALDQAGQREVFVRYEEHDPYVSFWELHVGDDVVRSFDDIATQVRQFNSTFGWAALLALGTAALCLIDIRGHLQRTTDWRERW